ncbi:microtubule-associated protein Jupiter-like [Tribolium madens]|uniref:microtubule-associated protein Jupiter-like n=1 Tax=Tribolium madens TaxID=41895 RepID=UPI001CF75F11|nr:microtubule-associated protein Jupiter-like [Tribolium madens]
MGDVETPSNENVTESPPPENATCDIPKPSIDILKEAKPSENIAINESNENVENPPIINIETTLKTSTTEDPVEEEPVDKLKNDNKKVDESVHNAEEAVIKQKEKCSLRNKSDIFSLNENKNAPSTIFSVGGAPSKTIHNTSVNSSKNSSSNETISSGASRQSQLRNPLTGMGVSSNDEFRTKPSKRKDGNPLLGVGYKDDDQVLNAPPSQRIPPGGWSKGLW